MDDSSKSYGIRIGLAMFGAAIGFALFGAEGKIGPIPVFFLCGWAGFFIGALLTWGGTEETHVQNVNTAPAKLQQTSSLREKTCPACISQVPFIASKCRFCGTDLVVEESQGGRPSISDQINESNKRNQN
jgi:hypothetical protein